MSADDLVRRGLAVNQAMLALGNEVFEAEGATFVCNRSVPHVRDANHVSHVKTHTPAEIDRLLARVEREFAGLPHRRFDVDALTPPEFEARLALEGYRRNEALVMVLDGDLVGAAKAHDVRSVVDGAAWEAYGRLQVLGWREYIERTAQPDESGVGVQLLRSNRAKAPPGRFWLVWVNGRPAAYLTSWEGTEGVGQVEDLFTHPDFRRRGLATALIHHGVADCRAHGAGPLVIVCDPDDTPKRMYAALGFRPLALKRSYWKPVEA